MKKRIRRRILPAAALLSLGIPAGMAATDTFTFTPGSPITIPSGSLTGVADVQNPAASINVIQNVSVSLNIAGNPTDFSTGDLYAYLRLDTPGGTGFTILLNRVGVTASDPFGYADTGFNVTFSAAAPNGDIHLYQNSAAYPNALSSGTLTGTWQPDGRNTTPPLVALDTDARTALLNSFDGLSAKGTWTLFVADVFAGSDATLNSWGITVDGLNGPFYWKGQTSGSWSAVGSSTFNWAADTAGTIPILATPDATSDVVFSATGATNQANTTLDQDFTIHSLMVNDTAPVVISSGAGGPHTLTIAGDAGTGITVGNGSNLTINSNVTLGGASDTVEVDGTGLAKITGVLDGSNGVHKTGTGMLTLTGVNTYTGGTFIDAGVVQIDNDKALSTGTVTMADGTELDAIGNASLSQSLSITSGATATLAAVAGKTLTLGGFNIGANSKTIFGSSGNTGVVVVGPISVLSSISASATVEVANGTLRAGDGTLLTGITSNITSTTVDAGATLDLNDFNMTVKKLLGAGSVTTGTNAATVLTVNDGDFSGGISGAGSLVKDTNTTFILEGTNTYTGSTTIKGGGTLQIGTAASAGSLAAVSNVDVQTGNTLQLVNVAGNTFANNISNSVAGVGTVEVNSANYNILSGVLSDGAGQVALTQSGSGTTALTGNNTYSGTTTINAGVLQVGNGGASGTTGIGGGSIVNNAVLAYDRTNLFTESNVISGSGVLRQIGSGATALTAANTYSGDTNIYSGMLLANNTAGSATGTSSVFINSGAALGGNGTISGAVTLNSGFIVPGAVPTGVSAGTLKIGSLTWNSGGTLDTQLGTTSDLLSITGALTKGTLGTYGINISDAGGFGNTTHYVVATFGSNAGFAASDFTLSSSFGAGLKGTLTLTGTELDFDITSLIVGGPILQNSAPVGTPIFADFIVGGPVTTGNPTENNQVHTLTFTPGSSLLIHHTLYVVQGPVTLVNGSSIQLDGNLSTSLLNMLAGSYLHGNGSIIGNLVNGGLLSPGNSPGQIHVTGNYTQTSSGTLRIEIAGRDLPQHDLLSVGGTASLNGTLQILPIDGFKLKRNKPITFLTANEGVIGRFSLVENSFPSDTILKPTVVYHDTSVTLDPVQASFANLDGLTPNQRAVGRALDSAAHDRRMNGIFDYLDYRKLNELPRDFDKIAPEELTSMFTIGISLANVQSGNIQRRTDDIRSGAGGFNAAGLAINGAGPSYSGSFSGVAGPNGNDGKENKAVQQPVAPAEDRWGAFLSGTGEWVSVGNTDNARGYTIDSGGFTLGLDYKVTPNLAIGVAAGYTGTSSDLTDGGRVYVNGGKVGIYATYYEYQRVKAAPVDSSKEGLPQSYAEARGFYADAAVFGGYNSYHTHRAALQDDATGDTDGGELNVLFGGGYDFKKGNFTFGPTASFNYTYLGTNTFTEHGSLAPLDIHGGKGESLRTAFGIKASYDWKVGGVSIKPEIRAAWQHEFGDAAYSLDSSFANGAGDSFRVSGPQLGRDSALLGAGFAIQLNERWSTYFYYDGELGRRNYQSSSVTGGLRMTF
ncbi:outer membrane autotransporter barrel domain protein [Chthoniobacter flavus Ellin428]|uniref:Outer membrane autotransporter barrel domain protein n=1 Tax=Chthoniobacter flavus Ellin428 TaxID=497964 RepID=B4D6D7_9BACT|nr:autotransporter domain-containing protein [Chthoniobacter flavus]EDY18046.1 outer membrane autotransporter barrel domain protein [Chthoniobacter flavus Ellin428]TCO88288.1 outer membrane autotransporter protein [Chthoniobacter flavus]